MQKTALRPRRSKASFIRQKPTRIPYSAQLQLGTSGMNSTPCGGVSIVRGKGASGSQTSTVTNGHAATVLLFGRRNGLRSMMALYSILSQRFMSFSFACGACSHSATEVPISFGHGFVWCAVALLSLGLAASSLSVVMYPLSWPQRVEHQSV